MTKTEDLMPEEARKIILSYCKEPHGRMAILEHLRVAATPDNYTKYMKQLVDDRLIAADLLIIRSDNKQRFVTTRKGLINLANLNA